MEAIYETPNLLFIYFMNLGSTRKTPTLNIQSPESGEATKAVQENTPSSQKTGREVVQKRYYLDGLHQDEWKKHTNYRKTYNL